MNVIFRISFLFFLINQTLGFPLFFNRQIITRVHTAPTETVTNYFTTTTVTVVAPTIEYIVLDGLTLTTTLPGSFSTVVYAVSSDSTGTGTSSIAQSPATTSATSSVPTTYSSSTSSTKSINSVLSADSSLVTSIQNNKPAASITFTESSASTTSAKLTSTSSVQSSGASTISPFKSSISLLLNSDVQNNKPTTSVTSTSSTASSIISTTLSTSSSAQSTNVPTTSSTKSSISLILNSDVQNNKPAASMISIGSTVSTTSTKITSSSSIQSSSAATTPSSKSSIILLLNSDVQNNKPTMSVTSTSSTTSSTSSITSSTSSLAPTSNVPTTSSSESSITLLLNSAVQNGNPTKSATLTSSILSTSSTSSTSSVSSSQATSTGVGLLSGPPSALVYSPYNNDGTCKDSQTVLSDLSLIKSKGVFKLRVYGTDCNSIQTVLPAAMQLGMTVNQGLWISSEGVDSINQGVLDIISWGQTNSWSVFDFITVGNEAIISNYCTVEDLISKISSVKQQLKTAGYTGLVTTAEPPVSYENNPSLCTASDIDFVGINPHAYFDTYSSAATAGTFVKGQVSLIQSVCGRSDVSVLETGYPSAGIQNGGNIPSPLNQLIAVQAILNELNNDVTILTTFDDYWKVPGSYGIEQSFGIIQLLQDA